MSDKLEWLKRIIQHKIDDIRRFREKRRFRATTIDEPYKARLTQKIRLLEWVLRQVEKVKKG